MSNSTFKRILTILTATTTVSAAAIAVPSAANAGAYGCRGSLVGSWRVPLKDLLTGETYYRSDIKLFYNPASGWNCAVLAKRPGQARYGEKTPLFIEMYNERFAEDAVKNNYDKEQGSFKYYAGPIKVYGKNMCLSIHAMHEDATGPHESYNGRRSLTGVACH
ncbi:hypothetical protein ACFLIM_33580 [Nonomuraea sp. M3C6]|uniref:Peptidase inhibitor family I36 n=1 Tax=Nonomuraea marmarensis TaxID=3351344 RepID=A0ABW7ALC2_9ACTN